MSFTSASYRSFIMHSIIREETVHGSTEMLTTGGIIDLKHSFILVLTASKFQWA